MKKFQTTQSDLLKYNGMNCKVLGELDKSQYDKKEVGTMYNIKLENGTKIQVFADELI